MSYDIFISYTQPVRDKALAIHDMFQSNKIASWIDKSEDYGIAYGRDFSGEIVRAIKTCKFFLLVYSKYTNTSEYVLDEVSFASESSKTIIVVRLDKSEYRDELSLRLSRKHSIDGSGGNWSKALGQLLSQIEKDLSTDMPKKRQTTDQFLLSNGAENLENKLYAEAQKDLQQYIDIEPKNSFARFLLVLSMIRGRKCRNLDGSEVKKIEQLLNPLLYDSENGYIRNLLAIVKRGYYTSNGLGETEPSSEELYDKDNIDEEKARIIFKHLYETNKKILSELNEFGNF